MAKGGGAFGIHFVDTLQSHLLLRTSRLEEKAKLDITPQESSNTENFIIFSVFISKAASKNKDENKNENKSRL